MEVQRRVGQVHEGTANTLAIRKSKLLQFELTTRKGLYKELASTYVKNATKSHPRRCVRGEKMSWILKPVRLRLRFKLYPPSGISQHLGRRRQARQSWANLLVNLMHIFLGSVLKFWHSSKSMTRLTLIESISLWRHSTKRKLRFSIR